jgi:hypothetical protein
MNSSSQLYKIQFRLIFCIVFGTIGFAIVCLAGTTIQEKWLETERQQILERVQSAGGWDVLRKDCKTLAEQYGNKSGDWRAYHNTNGLADLPAAIIALQPRRVEFYPPKTGGNWFNDSDFPVVRITVFSEFYTGPGGSDKPPLGLDILCGNSSRTYDPSRVFTSPSKFWTYQKMTNDVYEFYGFY